VVQFYEDDNLLVELLSRFIGTALITDDSAVVVATQRHRDALAQRLLHRGLDVSVAMRQQRYIPLDAEQTLASFMRGGSPDPQRFADVIGPVVEGAAKSARGRGRVAAFGEMVAILWAQGKIDAALQLEELWNKLAEKHAFSLCCAYPMKGFLGNPHAAPFVKICAQHSHVFPAERRRSVAAST
jgi:hypothetical protein